MFKMEGWTKAICDGQKKKTAAVAASRAAPHLSSLKMHFKSFALVSVMLDEFYFIIN